MTRHRENLIALYTLCRRETLRILRIWSQTLMPPVITMVLYFIIFGDVMGQKIGTMGGVEYISYIMPGLVMLAVINNSYMNTVSSFFFNKFQRNIEEMLVSPMPNSIIILGHVSGGVVRGLLVGILVIIASLFFSRLQIANWVVTIIFGFLTTLLFSLAGFINGVFAKKFDDISIVPMFILTPLSYLGGVFYSINLLPPMWQQISHYNPIFYIVNGFRHGILGQSDVPVEYGLMVIIFAVIVLYSYALWLLNKGVGVKS